MGKESFKELGWPFVIGIGKSGPLHTIHSQMVKLGPIEFEVLNNITQAGSASDLSKHHDYKLAPAIQGAILTLGSKAVFLDLSKIISVKRLLNRMCATFKPRKAEKYCNSSTLSGDQSIRNLNERNHLLPLT